MKPHVNKILHTEYFIFDMNTFMDDYGKTFCRKLKAWLENNYRGYNKLFLAELNDFIINKVGKDKSLIVTDKQLSNVINERRRGSERWRRIVSEFIGTPYEEMIGISVEAGAEIIRNKDTAQQPITEPVQIAPPSASVRVLLNMTREILESGTHWSDSLANNIESFYKGMIADNSDRRKTEDPTKIPDTGDRRQRAG